MLMVEAVAKCVMSKLPKTKNRLPMLDVHEIPKNAFVSSGNWTREQLKLAFHFYCQTPFGKLHSRNPEIIELAKLICRTPDALAMKLVNFASLDPSIRASGRSGLKGSSRLDREIWDEFNADWEGLLVECERLRLHLQAEHNLIDSDAHAGLHTDTSQLTDYTGDTRAALVQQRVKQQFFRRAVLSSYRIRCCISGVSDTRFLVASHIVPWRTDKSNRLNPSNGLCLSTIHDRAFDHGLFTLSDDCVIVLSNDLRSTKDEFLQKVFLPIDDKHIELPDRFSPSIEFLESHRRNCFVDAKR